MTLGVIAAQVHLTRELSSGRLPLQVASSADPPAISTAVSVCRDVLMPIGAMGLEGGNRRGANPSQDIFAIGDDFEVGGIDAMSNPAQMVEDQSVRDRPDQKRVCESMSADSCVAPESTVALGGKLGGPEPAGGGFLYLGPESLGDRYARILVRHLGFILRGVMGSDVDASRPPSIIAQEGCPGSGQSGETRAEPASVNSGQLPTYYINGLFPEPVSTPYTLRVEVYADGRQEDAAEGPMVAGTPVEMTGPNLWNGPSLYSIPFEPPQLFEFLEEFDSPKLAPIDLPTVRAAQLTEDEATAILAAAGWPAELTPQALAVAWCESKHSPGAIGDGGNSLGWFQLWTGWFYEGEDHFDALTNAKVALRVREVRGRWGGGGGWSCADHLGIP